MDLAQTKQIISDCKNIYLIPSESEPESLSSALALFYTLKELGKNVNLIVKDFPERLNFLVPSLDFISIPKNFVISIPNSAADISQIYYEKNSENLKIHLTVDKGQISKENVSFYFQEPKPDLIITLGIQDFKNHLEKSLDSFGFLLNSPILNIDNNQNNLKFGKISLIGEDSNSKIVLEIIKSLDEGLIKKEAANCILTGLMIYYQDLKGTKTTPEIFESVAYLIRKGANLQQVTENLNRVNEKEANFLTEIIKNLKNQGEVSVAVLDSKEFESFDQLEANLIGDKLKTAGFKNDLLVLWQSHASDSMVKGFFYSKKRALINKVAISHKAAEKDWVFLSVNEPDINLVKEKIVKLLLQ